MNRFLKKMLMITLSAVLFACGTKKETVRPPEESETLQTETETVQEETAVSETEDQDELQDLTFMNGTTLYSMVLNMVSDPAHYDGQKIRIRGYFAKGKDEEGNPVYGCIIPDATACCQQGFIIHLTEGQEYPQEGQWFDVEGTFRYELKQFTTDVILEDASIVQIIG